MVRRSSRLAAATMVLAFSISAIAAAVASDSLPRTFQAQAELVLTHVPPGAALSTRIGRLEAAATSHVPRSMLRGAHVRTASHAGDPAVTVVVTAPRPFQASHVANVLATEIVAADRGIDRRSLARRIKRLTTLASRLHGDRRSEAMRELRLARARQVTDADVHASGYAIQVSGPAPLRAAAVGGLVGALLGAALFAVSRRVTRLRRPV